MRKKIDFSLVFFLLLSTAICIESYKMGIGNFGSPLAGFFPFLTGILLGGIAGGKILFSLWSAKSEEPPRMQMAWKRVFPLLGALLGYALVMDIAGFSLATLFFVFLVLQWIESKPWWVAALAAFGIAGSIVLTFRVILEIQLPEGFLGF